jgi:hypothetical protein
MVWHQCHAIKGFLPSTATRVTKTPLNRRTSPLKAPTSTLRRKRRGEGLDGRKQAAARDPSFHD